VKDLYKGTFNYCGQILEVYRHAETENKAKWLMLRSLSATLRISTYRLRNYFDGSKDNYRIVKEVKK
jgi:hypothetical protein